VGATAQAIIARVMTEEPRSLTLQRHTIPPHIDTVVRKALEKLPADRFASAAAFAEALANPSYGVGTTSRGATAAGPAVRRSPVRRLAAFAPWVLLLAVSGAFAWRELRPRAPDVRRQRVVLRATPYPPGGVGLVVALAPDGETIVYPDTVGGTFQLWAKERSRLEASALTGTTGAIAPTFSPDGEWIAFVADNKLKKVPRLGGAAVTLADSAGGGGFPSIAWLANDTILFTSRAFEMLAVHQDGGPVRTVVGRDSIPQRGVTGITPLIGGRGALFALCTPGCTEQELRAVDLATGRMRVLADGAVRGWHTRDGDVVFVRQDGGVFRAPFDPGTMSFRRAPAPVMQGVRTIPGRADMQLGADGTLLYVEGAATVAGTPAEAVWVTRDGAATPVQAGWSFIPSTNPGIALSPDGRRLALSVRASGAEDVWVKELGGGPMTRLTFAGANIRPEWTADGRSIMYLSRTGSGNEELHMRAADGTGGERTLLRSERRVFEVLRTRDTTRLIVRYSSQPSRDIFLLKRGDTVPRPLLAESYHEDEPALSPDGRWLAYSSNESGRYEIYVRPFPAVDQGRWQVSREGGTEPRWSHGGRELFFRGLRDDLMVAAVAPGAAFVTSEVRTLFSVAAFARGSQHPYYAVAPDDRRFLFVRSLGTTVAGGPAYVTIVDNWLAELRAGTGR
jgi:serine/threonine-protein kinase